MVLSQKGWIRALRGHGLDLSGQKFKEGDGLMPGLGVLECATTDRLCLLASDGRIFTLRAGELPRGRGDGQPIRLMVELGQENAVLALFVLRDGARFLLATAGGRGLVTRTEDLVSEKRTGKQVLNLKDGDRALCCVDAAGDRVAVLGENRRLLVFPLEQVPVLSRGAGATLQRYKDGGLVAVRVFAAAQGLLWRDGAKVRSMTDLQFHVGQRAEIGRPAPTWLLLQ